MNRKLTAQVRMALGIGLVVGSVAQASEHDPLEIVIVESTPLPILGGERVIPEEGRGIAADGGELLRQVPGVSGSRLGGKGIDPAIRGQSQNRLNILIDGAYVFGGCPNRMDPPASFANIEAYDRVTVLKGVQTLRYGAGGPGGTVLFERGTPQFSDTDHFQGKAAASYGANGDRHSLFADLAMGNELGFLRLLASDAESNNYEDGDGDDVRSAYEEQGATLTAGLNLPEDSRIELSLESTRADDVLFAGGMDAPVDDNDTVRFKFQRDAQLGPFSSVKAEVYQTDVEHVMDNFSLREWTAPMRMQVDSDSITQGARVQGGLNFLGGEWTIGVEDQDSERDAIRLSGMMLPLTTTQSFLWPDVQIEQTGVFAEGQWGLGGGSSLKAGLRYDHVSADAGKAGATAATIAGLSTANDLYNHYYGITADKQSEDNVGGLLRFEQKLQGVTWFTGLSRAVRTADATERFMAANAMGMGGLFPERWVGNPEIEPEEHHQAEIGAAWAGSNWNSGIVVWGDWVNDYILRDRAHGQSDILQADNASIYRNVDARLLGFELEGGWRPAPHWTLAANLAYVDARNTSDGRDIAETPPLELTASIDYERSRWSAGAVLRAAAKQTEVEDDIATDSGLDVGKTSGWAALDLHGSYRFNKLASLDLGVDNLFDKTYAYHLNRGNAFDPTTVQVNEPGRSGWAKLNLRW